MCLRKRGWVGRGGGGDTAYCIRGKITTCDGHTAEHCARSVDRTDNAMCRLQRIAVARPDTVVVRHVCMIIIIIIRFGVWRDGGALKKNKSFPAERFYTARARVRTIGRVASANESNDSLKQKKKNKKKYISFLRVSFFYRHVKPRSPCVSETLSEKDFGAPLSVLIRNDSWNFKKRKKERTLIFSMRIRTQIDFFI